MQVLIQFYIERYIYIIIIECKEVFYICLCNESSGEMIAAIVCCNYKVVFLAFFIQIRVLRVGSGCCFLKHCMLSCFVIVILFVINMLNCFDQTSSCKPYSN